MNKVERAREMFEALENRRAGNVADIARRTFFIQDRLNKK